MATILLFFSPPGFYACPTPPVKAKCLQSDKRYAISDKPERGRAGRVGYAHRFLSTHPNQAELPHTKIRSHKGRGSLSFPRTQESRLLNHEEHEGHEFELRASFIRVFGVIRCSPLFLPVTYHFSLAFSARSRHNTAQRDTPDEAATNKLEPGVGQMNVVRPK